MHTSYMTDKTYKENIPLYLLMAIGYALCFAQVWLPHYFLTGDGPGHVYNSGIIYDLWRGKDTDFYYKYYNLVYHPNPNWLSTFLVSFFLFFAKNLVAEKLMLSIYILVYTTGFFKLIQKLSGTRSYWQLLAFVFVFTHTFSYGFFNFSFGIAFFSWLVWAWMNCLEKISAKNIFRFFTLLLLCYFSHLLPFVIGVFTCAALVLTYALSKAREEKPLAYFVKYAVILIGLLVPVLVLMASFVQQQSALNLHLNHFLDIARVKHFIQFIYLINVTHKEAPFAMITGVGLLMLFLVAVIMRIKGGIRLNKLDGMFLSMLLCCFIYFFISEFAFGIRMLLPLRMQQFAFILIACCISYMAGIPKIRKTAGVLFFACFICLSFFRIPCYVKASKVVEGFVAVERYIKPYSVVLPLNFCPNGLFVNGQYTTDRSKAFRHVSQYLGLSKPMIVLDNFEATYGYFPIIWKKAIDPYQKLGTYEGIEGTPPTADIEQYEQASGVTINNIVLWGYDTTFLQNAHFKEFYGKITAGYHKVDIATDGHTILFEKNPAKGVH
jgi:hypothetical protein